jgi:hypothetical protein
MADLIRHVYGNESVVFFLHDEVAIIRRGMEFFEQRHFKGLEKKASLVTSAWPD